MSRKASCRGAEFGLSITWFRKKKIGFAIFSGHKKPPARDSLEFGQGA